MSDPGPRTPSGRPLRVAVLVSGTGTVLQSLIDACREGTVPAEIVLVVSNVPDAFALERARAAGIPTAVLDHRSFASSRGASAAGAQAGSRPGGRQAFEAALRETLERVRVDLVCLAGWLRILSPEFVETFAGRIMNIHPALLPAFGGQGMYGERVHAAVLASCARVSGCTVHFVTEEPDGGPIIAQTAVSVEDGDTPATLSARVQREELRLYPLAVRLFAEGRLRIVGNRVEVRPTKPGTARSPATPGAPPGVPAGRRDEDPR